MKTIYNYFATHKSESYITLLLSKLIYLFSELGNIMFLNHQKEEDPSVKNDLRTEGSILNAKQKIETLNQTLWQRIFFSFYGSALLLIAVLLF